ncbi:MAG TPA: hypothetical protein VFO27_08505 [Bryobacteraceae bacterium]|nr:hypothetical protein [Bryobacteraceae bacterium]
MPVDFATARSPAAAWARDLGKQVDKKARRRLMAGLEMQVRFAF